LAALAIAVLAQRADHSAAQEVGLTPLEATEVAKGHSADALKLKTVVNEKNEQIGRINDFIFGRDGNTYVVLDVDSPPALSAILLPSPSAASSWTIPPIASSCRERTVWHYRSYPSISAINFSLQAPN
jgi:hypothetical protein